MKCGENAVCAEKMRFLGENASVSCCGMFFAIEYCSLWVLCFLQRKRKVDVFSKVGLMVPRLKKVFKMRLRDGFLGSGMRFGVVFLWFILACLVTSCEEIEEEKPWIQRERPQMLFVDTTLLDSYDKSVLGWRLKTAYLERWADKEIVVVRPVLVDIYDSVGAKVAFLRADSGRLDMKFTYVYAYGHVYALTPKGASVRADSLLWNKADNLVKTESYVRVVSEDGDVLQGKGFESDAKMENWKILSNVTGIFQDAAKRFKEEDKKQAEVFGDAVSSSAVVSSSSAVAKPAVKRPASSASTPAKTQLQSAAKSAAAVAAAKAISSTNVPQKGNLSKDDAQKSAEKAVKENVPNVADSALEASHGSRSKHTGFWKKFGKAGKEMFKDEK